MSTDLPHVPPHWPVSAPGLVMAYVGPTMVAYVDERLGPASFEIQLRELEIAFAKIEEAERPGVKHGAIFEVAEASAHDARRRKRIAELLGKRAPLLRRTTSQFVLVTPSPLVRGIARAIDWLAPPPYPTAVVATAREAFDLVARTDTIDPALDHERYQRLLTRYAPR